MNSAKHFNADFSWALNDNEPIEGAFTLDTSNVDPDKAVVTSVQRPWLFGFQSQSPTTNNRAILICGGGGYVELMVGREGLQVARWLTKLGFHAFVLVHRFPNAQSSSQAPLDDARRALKIIEEKGFAKNGLGVCGLSSGGHLAASLLAEYPRTWREENGNAEPELPRLQFAIIGYAPISTNAVGRTIVPDKAPLPPRQKQELYNTLQPDVQLQRPAPPTFIVYSGNDPVVPVVNAYRLAEGVTQAGGTVELHVFADAPHGFALDTPGLPVSDWVGMCERWLGQGGFLEG
ncbi:alpha/beta-hydrolase [Cucurbitaria berberidis CBS 394.84]|uniref:Alpha/beta-hydrolase n=1 Tax=Cucurbitaria berberidis CBS 394.84 TaxID=1168544 RepID=A0A9P4GFU4_9PLEO|nr:alpha/beta-hydrolase [Cucurbitaria berberidis CBS 394.84]KAF1844481.1 alpha/beta-hydrolase [Cucurbitaria berberidis CBS 394.84]